MSSPERGRGFAAFGGGQMLLMGNSPVAVFIWRSAIVAKLSLIPDCDGSVSVRHTVRVLLVKGNTGHLEGNWIFVLSCVLAARRRVVFASPRICVVRWGSLRVRPSSRCYGVLDAHLMSRSVFSRRRAIVHRRWGSGNRKEVDG